MINRRALTPDMKRAVLRTIEKAWLASPELRLGQLLCNASGHDLFYVEDHDLEDLVSK
jgi:hypothetical protein